MHKCALEVRALLELVVIPILGSLLPGKVCHFIYSWLAGCDWLYRDQVAQAGAYAQRYQAIPDIQKWSRQARFHLLIDQLDGWQTRLRGNGWLYNNVKVVNSQCLAGQEPGILFVTFHWGQGFWALKWLNNAGYNLAWLHAPVPQKLDWGGIVAGLVGRLRIAQVGRLAGAEPIAVQGSIEKMRARLVEKKQPVLAMPDAPLQEGRSSIAVRLLNREAKLPAGLIKMAAREAIPVCVYTIKIDQKTGRRNLRFNEPVREKNPEILAQYLADRLTEAVEEDSSAWYVWPHAGGFFSPS